MSECPFCAPDRHTQRNAYAAVIPDGFPVTDGHVLVVPLRHTPDLGNLHASEWTALWDLVRDVRLGIPGDANIGVNDGPAAGRTVDHAHVHVIPRQFGDVADPRGGVRWVIPDRAPVLACGGAGGNHHRRGLNVGPGRGDGPETPQPRA